VIEIGPNLQETVLGIAILITRLLILIIAIKV
jgi:hypothetical protein